MSNTDSPNMSKSSYRQKYKHAWELDNELKGWLTACTSDTYAAFCKFCRTKLHAHKKGLLAHAKSAKHKKHVSNPNYDPNDTLSLVPVDDNEQQQQQQQQQHLQANGDPLDDQLNDSFRNKSRSSSSATKSYKFFNDTWLKEPSFTTWLRRVPNNNTKALCIACRCVITAGRCELVKHTRAAKHKKAMLEGPFEEVNENDLQWLENCQNEKDHQFNTRSMVSINDNHQRQSMLDMPGLFVKDIIDRLTKHLPLELAEKWDNVGVLVEPTQPVKVYNILLTIDLTEEIVEEAIKKRSQFIISYHPPIFNPFKRLDNSEWKSKAILMCIENRIAIYSPHTALDAVKGGVNDWLVSPFLTSEEDKIEPIQPKDANCFEVVVTAPEHATAVVAANSEVVQVENDGEDNTNKNGDEDVAMAECVQQTTTAEIVTAQEQHHYAPITGLGMGRIIKLATPLPLYEVIERTKSHLGVNLIKVALYRKHSRTTKINSIAVCAGSGSSVLKGCQADVWITGEMSHHDVLDAVNNGVTVIAGQHSNTERGFLRDWSQQLKSSVFEDKVMVTLSDFDKDPYRII